MYNHILLEVYCLKESDENKDKESPHFCFSNDHTPQYNCIINDCPYVTFTTCENTLSYVNQNSEAETRISLGKDNYTPKQLSLWKRISHKAIDGAYDEFLNQIDK